MSEEKAQPWSREKENLPYIVLEGRGIVEIQVAVQEMLNKGYVPLGGVQVVAHRPEGLLTGTVFKFYQTMVFNEA